jgi:hypothetical protein
LPKISLGQRKTSFTTKAGRIFRIGFPEAETLPENTGGSSPAAPLLFFPRLD